MNNINRKSPGVIINTNITSKVEYEYPISTVLLGYFEQGTTDLVSINTVQDFFNIYGNVQTKDSISALSYLRYAKGLKIKRVIGLNSFNASTGPNRYMKVLNYTDFLEIDRTNFLLDTEFIRIIAKSPGAFGNNITVALFTDVEHKLDRQINKFYTAKQIVKRVPYLNYCLAVFNDDKLVETFVVAFNKLEDINSYSNYIYLKAKITINMLSTIDGITDLYDGNLDTFFGGSDLFDGNFDFIDGLLIYTDGNVQKPLFYVPLYFENTLLKLNNGTTEMPTNLDYEEARTELEDITGYDIDFCICTNISLRRNDIINFVPVPRNINSAIDYAKTYDMKMSTAEQDTLDNLMFIYGEKKVGTLIVPLVADYCGLRVQKIIEEGIEFSTSKFTTPLLINKLQYSPKYDEQELLYENGINVIINENNNIYCNGEQLYRSLDD